MRVLIRYRNRKLYDAETSNFVCSVDIMNFIKEGLTVKILDCKTRVEVTSEILTRLITNEGIRQDRFLSIETLHDIIKQGGIRSYLASRGINE